MSWFKKWGKTKPSQLYLSREGNISMLPRYTSPPKKNTEEWIDYFRRTPRLAVVERIASDLSFAPGKLYAVDSSGEESEILNHPFLTFWNKANPMHEFSTAALWRLFEIYLLLKGEGYFVIERDVLGRPLELWPVPVHWVQMTPYEGNPFYTIRTTAGWLMNVSVDDMFVMKDLDPYDPFQRGLGQSESLADEIEIDEYAAKFQKTFFLNDATPDTLVTMEESTAEQRERLLASWEERFRGVRNSHKLNIVKGKVTVQKLSDSMKDMDMIQGRIFVRDAVLEHYGVPREIMGITESSNRATSESAQFIYAQNVLMPKLRRREEAINTQLIPLFGEGLVWRFDDIVPRNQQFDKEKALDAFNAGLMTRNEARKLLDLDEVENGNVFKTTFSDIYLSEEEDPSEVSYNMAELQFADTPVQQEGAKETTYEVYDDSNSQPDEETSQADVSGNAGEVAVASDVSLNGAQISSLIQIVQAVNAGELGYDSGVEIIVSSFPFDREKAVSILGDPDSIGQLREPQGEEDRLKYTGHTVGTKSRRCKAFEKGLGKASNKLERQFEQAAARRFVRQASAIESALKGGEKADDDIWSILNHSSSNGGDGDRIDDFIDRLCDWKSMEEGLLAAFSPLWQESYQEGCVLAKNAYGFNGINQPKLYRYAQEHGAEKVKYITETTKNNIREIIVQGLQEGKTKETLCGEIIKKVGFESKRSRMIAQTETHASIMAGNVDMMKAGGVQYKQWRTWGDDAVREKHKDLNGKIIPFEDEFKPGLKYPGDPACNDPSEVINCRCYINPINY